MGKLCGKWEFTKTGQIRENEIPSSRRNRLASDNANDDSPFYVSLNSCLWFSQIKLKVSGEEGNEFGMYSPYQGSCGASKAQLEMRLGDRKI